MKHREKKLALMAVDHVSRSTGVTADDILGTSKLQRIARVRHMAVILLRDHFEFSWGDIAILLATGRPTTPDRSSVRERYERGHALYDHDGAFRELYDVILTTMPSELNQWSLKSSN